MMGSVSAQAELGNQVGVEKFFAGRDALIAQEKERRSDYEFRQSLSSTATQACEIVSRIREEERCKIWKTQGNPELNEKELFPGMMFNVAKNHMESTKLWQIVRKMPKGTLLHCHIGATVDLEWVFNKAIDTPGMAISSPVALDSVIARQSIMVNIRHSSKLDPSNSSIWTLEYAPNALVSLKEAANTFPDGGRAGFVAWMKDRCSITQTESLQHHLGVDDVWRKLSAGFIMLTPVIYYEPILRAFVRQLFLTLIEDGVRWVEMRAVLSSAITLEGKDVPEKNNTELSRVLNETIESFMASEESKGFWGARMIWTAMRHHPTSNIIDDMKQCIAVKKRYPNLIAGYDVVGQEDLGRTLHDLTPELLWFLSTCTAENLDIPFFFHAGECLGDGDATDNNLFDAILFGSRRLGHGFSLYKHPLLVDMVKERSILVESCPISNEVLRYTASIMSHPLPALLSRGVKAALSNDDPSMLGQGTSGLTHDFWQALQGWDNLGLAGLGSLAQNSVRWAVFEDQETDDWLKGIEDGASGSGLRAKRILEWNAEWEDFCKWIVAEFGSLY